MYQWERQIQSIVDEIDRCIRQQDSEALTLQALWATQNLIPPESSGRSRACGFGIICGAGGWPLP